MNPGKYVYLVYFHYKKGEGSKRLLRSKKIKHEDDIKGIQEFIEKDSNIENVGVASYQLIRKVPFWERI